MALASCFATAVEKRRPLPGDGMVPNPIFTSTHAVTIDAPPEEVWPWIAQKGGGRAGWYSWDSIDNGDTPSSTSLVPVLQCVVPGDVIPAVPGATEAFVVAAVEPLRDWVLAIGFGATAFGTRLRLYSIVTIVVLLLFGGLTFLEAPRLQMDLPTPWIGLWERINISAFLLWVVMLGAVPWRTGTPQGEASKRAAERIPGARFVSLNSGGHLMIGQRKKQREALARFFAETPARGVEQVAS